MTDEELERCRRPRGEWECATCGQSPTCPQLRDELWSDAWAKALVAGVRPVPCTCERYEHGDCVKAQHYDDPRCARNRRRRELLCLECVEKLVGRPLTLDDLLPCIGNYPTEVMVRRFEQLVRDYFQAQMDHEAAMRMRDAARYKGETFDKLIEAKHALRAALR